MPARQEVCLDSGGDPERFMREAAAFANDRCWGTLSCSVFVHPATQARAARGGRGGGGAAALGIRLRQGTRGHLQDVRCSPPRRHVPEQLQCRADEGRWLGVRWRQAWPAAGGPCMVPAASAYSPCPGPHPTPPLQRQHREAFDRLIEELRYGAIAVNGAIATRAAVGATRRVARKRCPPWPA